MLRDAGSTWWRRDTRLRQFRPWLSVAHGHGPPGRSVGSCCLGESWVTLTSRDDASSHAGFDRMLSQRPGDSASAFSHGRRSRFPHAALRALNQCSASSPSQDRVPRGRQRLIFLYARSTTLAAQSGPQWMGVAHRVPSPTCPGRLITADLAAPQLGSARPHTVVVRH
jgi:hypothetical protein